MFWQKAQENKSGKNQKNLDFCAGKENIGYNWQRPKTFINSKNTLEKFSIKNNKKLCSPSKKYSHYSKKFTHLKDVNHIR